MSFSLSVCVDPQEPNTVKVDPNDSNHGVYLWKIENWSTIREAQMYSPNFEMGGFRWRLLVFPRGNGAGHKDLAFYLDTTDSKLQPPGWHRTAHFMLSVVHPTDKTKNSDQIAKHMFVAEESDWGFTEHMKLSTLNEQYLEKDTLTLTAEIQVIKTFSSAGFINWWTYNSRRETGYVGLANQGATCYMNSLLQVLFNIPRFRAGVFAIPTSKSTKGDATSNIPLALQRLFFHLEYEDTSVSTRKLTKAFGWDSLDAFTQHDVQELKSILTDNLETKMKGTPAEGTVNRLFEGKTRSYVKCVNIDYESSRQETFQDLTVTVEGCKTLHDSLKKFVEVEMLDGDNQYHAEGHGKQDAKKGVYISSLPPVFTIHMMRFGYDWQTDTTRKINDRFEFPETLDMSEYLDPDAPKDNSPPPLFRLHSVLVHSGDVHGGHYYAFIRPTMEENWFKFDDERVTKAEAGEAIEANYGGVSDYSYTLGGRSFSDNHKKYSNAYMLVYVRQSDAPTLLAPLRSEEIPEDLVARFVNERKDEEARRKERESAHLYCTLFVATDADIKAHSGFDLVDWPSVTKHKLLKTMKLKDAVAEVAAKMKVPPFRMRFWNWVGRQNGTSRPDAPVKRTDMERTIGDIFRHTTSATVGVELSKAAPTEMEPANMFPPLLTTDAVIYFKYYNAKEMTLKTVGWQTVSVKSKIGELTAAMNALIGRPADTKLDIYEEIKPDMIDLLKHGHTLEQGELGNGDILAFQPQDEAKAAKEAGSDVPDVKSYYDDLVNRVTVTFKLKTKIKESGFDLPLSKKTTYEEVTKKIAEHLKVDDHKKLRLFRYYYNMPPRAIKLAESPSVGDMVYNAYRDIPPIVYYEVLEERLETVEARRDVTVSYLNAKGHEREIRVAVLKTGTVGDLLERLRGVLSKEATTYSKPDGSSDTLRLLKVSSCRISKVFDPLDPLKEVQEHFDHRVEWVPTDEADKSKKRVQVVHYSLYRQYVLLHGHPFFMMLSTTETVGSFKKRVQARLGISDEEFAKWKFAQLAERVAYGDPKMLEDDDASLAEHDPKLPLGFEHEDKSPPKSYRSNYPEKSIKIHN